MPGRNDVPMKRRREQYASYVGFARRNKQPIVDFEQFLYMVFDVDGGTNFISDTSRRNTRGEILYKPKMLNGVTQD